MSDYMEGVISIWIVGAVFAGVAATYSLEGGEAVAFGVFWPITVPLWLLINLYRLAKRVRFSGTGGEK